MRLPLRGGEQAKIRDKWLADALYDCGDQPMLVVDRQEVKFVGGPRRKQQRRGKKPKLETEKSKFWGKMYQCTSTESQKKTEDSWKCRKCTKQSSNKTATNNKCNSKKNLQWTTAVRILQQNLQILKIQHQWRLSDVKEIAKKAGMARKVLIKRDERDSPREGS